TLTVMAFVPAESGIEAVQDVVPVALLKAPPLFCHWTSETMPGAVSDAVPASASGVVLVAKSSPVLVVIVIAGRVLSRTTVMVVVVLFPAASVAFTSMKLLPAASVTAPTDHEVVPV